MLRTNSGTVATTGRSALKHHMPGFCTHPSRLQDVTETHPSPLRVADCASLPLDPRYFWPMIGPAISAALKHSRNCHRLELLQRFHGELVRALDGAPHMECPLRFSDRLSRRRAKMASYEKMVIRGQE